MNSNAHVDVVMAEGEPATATLADRAADAPVTVDVASDPARRVVVVAQTKALGDVVSDVAVRGHGGAWRHDSDRGDAAGLSELSVVWADDLTHEERADLEPHVLPSLATTRVEES
jgi:hypothetical protein